MKSVETTFQLVTSGDLSGNFTSQAWAIPSYSLVSLHWWISSGSATGSLTVQVSDYEDFTTDGYLTSWDMPASPTLSKWQILSNYIPQWVNLESVKTFPITATYAATAITASSPASGIINIDGSGFKWVRLVYTRSSGSGSLQVRATGKRNKSSVI